MSTLKLNLNGSSEPLINYLKIFAKIQNSLLLEIDTEYRIFAAKIFTRDRGAIRFSSISFEDCCINIVSDDAKEERGAARIKVGILIQLNKLIKIIERFGSDVNKENKSDFIISINYDMMDCSTGSDYVATTITFKNNYLKMKMDGFKLSELFYLSDERFKNDIFNVEDPVILPLSTEIINSVIKTTDIVKMDPLSDSIRFYVENKDVYVSDSKGTDDREPNFIYKLGTLENNPGYPISVVILRDKFIQMVDRIDKGCKLILGQRKQADEYVIDRILFDSEDGMTKVVIGAQCG